MITEERITSTKNKKKRQELSRELKKLNSPPPYLKIDREFITGVN